MSKNRKMLVIAGVVIVAIGIGGCGNKNVSTAPETSAVVTSEEDLDAVVAKKVQEQLEIDRRVKESVDAARAQETEATTAAPTTAAPATNTGTYILPFSDSRLVTDNDLAKLSKAQLRLARNEIYARHGRIYESEDLNNYFRSQGWYQPSVTADQWNDNVFSSIESQNVQRIANYEKNGTIDTAVYLLWDGRYTTSLPGGSDSYTFTFFSEYPDENGGYMGDAEHDNYLDNGTGMGGHSFSQVMVMDMGNGHYIFREYDEDRSVTTTSDGFYFDDEPGTVYVYQGLN